MIKVELLEAYGTGAMGHKYWTYETTVIVKNSVKRAIAHAYKQLFELAEDKTGFNYIPIFSNIKVYKNNKLIMEKN